MNKMTICVLLCTALGLAAEGQGGVVVSWGSVVDNGALESTLGVGASAAPNSTKGAGIYSTVTSTNVELTDLIAGGSPTPTIAGGEIIYATTPAGTLDDATTASEAIADEQWFQFSLTVGGLAVDESLDLSSFTYTTHRNTNGSSRISWGDSQLALRVNDTAFTAADLIGGVNNDPNPGDQDTFTITSGLSTGLVNGDIVNFRIYAWGSDDEWISENDGDSFNSATRLGAVSVGGSVAAIPEPSSIVLLGAALGTMLILRRRSRKGNTSSVPRSARSRATG